MSPPRLENRLPAEGINSSREHPLREAAWLVGSVLVVFALLLFGVGELARWLAPRLPFEAELKLMAALPAGDPQQGEAARRSRALQALADRVAAAMDLPPGMPIQLRSEARDELNAYATLGGRVRVFDGLYTRIRHEETMAALLAHEIAHVRERHVAAQLGRGLAGSLLLSLLSADAGGMAAQQLLGQGAQLGLFAYSREQEAAADAAALAALQRLYGEVGGLAELLELLREQDGEAPTALRSHPAITERLAAARQLAEARGWTSGRPQRPWPGASAE